MRNRFRNRRYVLHGRCVRDLPLGLAYRCFIERLLVSVCCFQGVTAVQIHNEYKVGQCMSDHDRQKEVG
jgi:hypothetical protein